MLFVKIPINNCGACQRATSTGRKLDWVCSLCFGWWLYVDPQLVATATAATLRSKSQFSLWSQVVQPERFESGLSFSLFYQWFRQLNTNLLLVSGREAAGGDAGVRRQPWCCQAGAWPRCLPLVCGIPAPAQPLCCMIDALKAAQVILFHSF